MRIGGAPGCRPRAALTVEEWTTALQVTHARPALPLGSMTGETAGALIKSLELRLGSVQIHKMRV